MGTNSWGHGNAEYLPPGHDEEHDRILADRRRNRPPRRWAWPAGIVGVVVLAYVLTHLVLHLL